MIDFMRESPGVVAWTVLILAIAVCYVAKVMGEQWRLVRQTETEAVLKEQMIQRGMSVQEIAQVLQAGPVAALEPEGRQRSSSDARWLWLALGVPVALFVLCASFMTMASMAVLSYDAPTAIVADELEPPGQNNQR